MKTFIIKNLEELEGQVKNIIEAFQSYKIIFFIGEMGAGKTTLISLIAREMGVTATTSSPTFALVNEYPTPTSKIYHFDLYRLKNLQEVRDIGMEEYLDSGNYCFIEWPQLIEHLAPEALQVHIELVNGERHIKILPPMI